MRSHLRRLSVDGHLFLWNRRHFHNKESRRCRERLHVFSAANKNGFLQIDFLEGNGVGVGYPQNGVVFWFEREETYNLNRPSVVAALIRYALQNGWSPDSENRPIRWSYGIELLTLSQAPSDLSRIDLNLGRFWVPRNET